jgi:hypothetical protein
MLQPLSWVPRARAPQQGKSARLKFLELFQGGDRIVSRAIDPSRDRTALIHFMHP